MFECYISFGDADRRAPERLTCAAAFLGEDTGESALARRWRYLLIKHELKEVDLTGWRDMAAARGWNAATQAAVLGEFIDASLQHDHLGFLVCIDPSTWRTLEPRTRHGFGSMSDFCLQRLARLVLDRLEATQLGSPVTIVLERDIDRLGPLSEAITGVYSSDSRASEQIATIQFLAPTRSPGLQASRLIAAVALKHVAGQMDRARQAPALIRNMKFLPALPDTLIREIWDADHGARHAAALHWMAGDQLKPRRARRGR